MKQSSKNDIINRIQQCFNLNTKGEVAAFLGVKPQTLSNWISRNSIDYDIVFTKCVGIDFNWLISGIGEKKLKDFDHPIDTKNPTTQNEGLTTQFDHPIAEFDPHVSVVRAKTITEAEQGIPLIPLEAAAGPFLGNSAQIFDYDCERYVVPEFSKADFLIRITGDSMEPYYIAGDMVACKKLPLDTFFQWNEVYLIDSEQGVLIKRVKPGSTPATLSLVSENKAYDPVELERAEVYGLARVLGLLRFN